MLLANSTITIKSSDLLSQLVDSSNSNNNNSNNGSLMRTLLQLISTYLDKNGAADEWNLRYVAIVSAIILGTIRYGFGKKYGIDWCALVHALVTTIGAVSCWYIDTYYESYIVNSSSDAGSTSVVWSEPMRTISMCTPPITSLHRILAPITMGYSILDFIHGLTLGSDFLFHGLITMGAMGYVVEMHVPQIVSSLLMMEGSTIFLSMIRATFFNETITIVNMILFVLSFILCRCIMAPYLWWKLLCTIVENYKSYKYQSCYPRSLMDSVFVSGMMFHCLNMFWLYKIIQKIRRKLSGTEQMTANNDIVEEVHKKKD